MLLPCHRSRVQVRHLAMGSGMVTRCLVPEARTWVLAVGLPCSGCHWAAGDVRTISVQAGGTFSLAFFTGSSSARDGSRLA